MIKIGKIIFVIFIIFWFLGCSKEQKKENITSKNFTKEKIEHNKYKLKDIDGKTLTLTITKNKISIKNIKGKIILLDFFATWCPPCKAEIPHLVNLQKKYKDKLFIIGILLEKNKNLNELKKFKENFEINYFISNTNFNFEIAKKIYAFLQAPKNMPIPLMVMYKDGKYVIHYIGAVPEEMIESDIKKSLGE